MEEVTQGNAYGCIKKGGSNIGHKKFLPRHPQGACDHWPKKTDSHYEPQKIDGLAYVINDKMLIFD